MKVLYHCHTNTSPCSNIKQQDLITFLDDNNYDAVIVTDHDTVTKLNWQNGLVIPGSEITSEEGDVIGIFIKNKVPKGLSIAETSRLIRKQGGLVIAPHPCDKLRREAMGTETFLSNLNSFDIVESYNSRNIFNNSNILATQLAKRHRIPEIIGSDAHTLGELPNTYIEMPSFKDQKSFLKSLQSATSKRKSSGPIPHVKTIFIRLEKKIAQRLRHQ